MDDPSRHRWEGATEWPLTLAAVLFLAAYAWPILDPDLGQPWLAVCYLVNLATWGLFALDYVVRLWLSAHRPAFVRTHLVDLALIMLPMLRPLRLLRLVTVLTLLNRHAGGSLRGRVAVYVGGATSLLIFVAALAVLEAERARPGSDITSFADALWWAFVTVTTVGYGDLFPVTTTGRLVAVVLMLAGVALLGVVTAALASWMLDRVRQIEDESKTATRGDIVALREEVAALRAELDHRSRDHQPDRDPGR